MLSDFIIDEFCFPFGDNPISLLNMLKDSNLGLRDGEWVHWLFLFPLALGKM